MRPKLLSLLVLSCMIISCGKSDSKSASLKHFEPIAPELMHEMIQQQTIWCTDKESCPEGIGRMFALSAASYRPTIACSTILVAADMVMTNSHCAYIGVSDLNKTCDSLYFAFSNASGRVEAARCSKILWRDKRLQGSDRYRRGDNDFALIKLDHPLSITPLKFSSQPIQRGDTVYPMVVDQVSGVQARIVKLECSVKKIDVRTGVATLSNCPIIAGNSGSAILNEEKNIVGIIFASSNLGIRGANEDLSTRSSGTSNGFAYTTEHLRKILGSLLDLSSGEYPL